MDMEALKKICHDEKSDQPGWYFIHRNVSIRITKHLIRYDIKPNQVSVLMILVGSLGSLFLGSRLYVLNFAGIFILYLSFLLDKVDGEIARYKKAFSANGIVIDWLYHRIFIIGVYMGICLKLDGQTSEELFFMGLLSSFLAILIEDNQFVSYILYAQKLYKKSYLFKASQGNSLKSALHAIYKYTKIMKVFRTNITIIYMLLPLYMIGFIYPAAFSAFIQISLIVNAAYF
jgi:phosphatidylglycerophosphate synthase